MKLHYANERQESYETMTKEDQDLISMVKNPPKEEIYDYLNQTKCYIRKKDSGFARNHICGGTRDLKTKEIMQKCIHCRFFFPVPTFKDVTPR